jgi:hypothetical protein
MATDTKTHTQTQLDPSRVMHVGLGVLAGQAGLREIEILPLVAPASAGIAYK